MVPTATRRVAPLLTTILEFGVYARFPEAASDSITFVPDANTRSFGFLKILLNPDEESLESGVPKPLLDRADPSPENEAAVTTPLILTPPPTLTP